MSNDKDIFSEALDPANEDNWVDIRQAQYRPNRKNIYRVTIPGMSTQILKAKVLTTSDDAVRPTRLEPCASGLPTITVSTCYVEQYCPTPTLPTETLSDIYNVEAYTHHDGFIKFARMVLDFDGDWIGVDSEKGEAHYIRPKDIVEFSLTPTKP